MAQKASGKKVAQGWSQERKEKFRQTMAATGNAKRAATLAAKAAARGNGTTSTMPVELLREMVAHRAAKTKASGRKHASVSHTSSHKETRTELALELARLFNKLI